jgi:hypothetical protein
MTNEHSVAGEFDLPRYLQEKDNTREEAQYFTRFKLSYCRSFSIENCIDELSSILLSKIYRRSKHSKFHISWTKAVDQYPSRRGPAGKSEFVESLLWQSGQSASLHRRHGASISKSSFISGICGSRCRRGRHVPSSSTNIPLLIIPKF